MDRSQTKGRKSPRFRFSDYYIKYLLSLRYQLQRHSVLFQNLLNFRFYKCFHLEASFLFKVVYFVYNSCFGTVVIPIVTQCIRIDFLQIYFKCQKLIFFNVQLNVLQRVYYIYFIVAHCLCLYFIPYYLLEQLSTFTNNYNYYI